MSPVLQSTKKQRATAHGLRGRLGLTTSLNILCEDYFVTCRCMDREIFQSTPLHSLYASPILSVSTPSSHPCASAGEVVRHAALVLDARDSQVRPRALKEGGWWCPGFDIDPCQQTTPHFDAIPWHETKGCSSRMEIIGCSLDGILQFDQQKIV